jgi:branched-chain amino acid transport system permease protein
MPEGRVEEMTAYAADAYAVRSKPKARRVDRGTIIGSVATVILLMAAPLVIYPIFVMKLMCYALFAAAFNLLIGYAGLLSFGHAAFFGTGAYITAYAASAWGLDPILNLVLSIAVAALLGTATGYLAIRRKGIEFSMITLALAQMVAFAAHRLPLTGGENGIQGVPRGHLFGQIDLNVPENIYAFILVIFVFGMFILWRTVNSPFGHILQAIREHESRAISLGYDVARFKLTAFIISSAIAGLAGGMSALIFQIATLDGVSYHLSGEVVLMALLGGVGQFFGPLVGAAIVVSLESYLATSPFPAPVLTGAVFIACVLLFRRGVVGEIAARIKQLNPRSAN